MHVATRSLYSNQQRKVDTEDLPPSIPPSSMPALGVSGPSSGSRINQPRPGGPLLSYLKPPRSTPIHRRLKVPEPSTDIDDKLLKDFCSVTPFSLEASNLVHDVVQGESDLFRIPRRRQIALMYKVFQHCWLWSLRELHYLFSFMHEFVNCLCQNLSIKERRAHQPPDSM